MKRNHNPNRIKVNFPYSIAEICETLGVHKNTAHNWIKDGSLKKIDSSKPIFVHGSDLKEFLQKRKIVKKSKCQADEFFCLKCQKSQKPFGNLVDAFLFTKTRGNLQGICPVCSKEIYRSFGVKKLDSIRKTFDVGTVHGLHLIECLSSSDSCDLT